MKEIQVTQQQIDEVIGQCFEADLKGSTYPGMTYEQGVLAAIDWITGETEDNPFD